MNRALFQTQPFRSVGRWLLLPLIVAVSLLLTPAPSPAMVTGSLPEGWREIAPPGLGNPANSVAWGMEPWGNHLYLSTTQSWGCWIQWSLHVSFPFFPYPPDDPDMECAEDVYDNPMTGEIWRWRIADETWEQVYSAPHTIPVPDNGPLARDVGYRGMALFTEPDGTTALYVSGMLPKTLVPGDPLPPRILRSTDGTTFEALPQEPGTQLGDADRASFRALLDFKDRLLVVMGSIYGSGPLWAAADPAMGNDAFTTITPDGTNIFEMAVYQDQLYIGTTDEEMVQIPGYVGTGYRVLRSDLEGDPPYQWTTVVDNGAYLDPPSRSVASMTRFDDRLYVGTDITTELIRINPDDSWELVVGPPRDTPSGYQEPLSGYGAGFDWPYNVHFWRMTEYDDRLYVGTADDTFRLFRHDPATFGHHFGFDLWYSDEGWYFYPLTIDGFGDPLQWGVRNFDTISKGLVMGTGSFWSGLRLWLLESPHRAYLPFVAGGQGTTSTATLHTPALRWDGLRPLRLEGLVTPSGNRLSWEAAPGSARFLVYRSHYRTPDELGVDAPDPDQLLPLEPALIGTTTDPFFIDDAPGRGPYRYTVMAATSDGAPSPMSNSVTLGGEDARPLAQQAQSWLGQWLTDGEAEVASGLLATLTNAQQRRQTVQAGQTLERLNTLLQSASLPAWREADIDLLLYRLERQQQLWSLAP